MGKKLLTIDDEAGVGFPRVFEVNDSSFAVARTTCKMSRKTCYGFNLSRFETKGIDIKESQGELRVVAGRQRVSKFQRRNKLKNDSSSSSSSGLEAEVPKLKHKQKNDEEKSINIGRKQSKSDDESRSSR